MRRLFPLLVVTGLAFGLLVTPGRSLAQTGGGGAYSLQEGERNLKFTAVPIPNYSDVLGPSLGVVGMAYYKMDRDDDALPPSSSGLFGFYSQNNSWVGMAFQKFHFPGDLWRATAAVGSASVKYQFNPAGLAPGAPDIFVDYTTVSNFLFLKGARAVRRPAYLGLEAIAWSAQVSLEPDLVDVPNEHYRALGGNGEWDRRDHVMYPTAGFNAEARFDLYNGAFGSDRDFRKLIVKLSGYTTLGDSTRVLAGRILTESAFGDVPFSGQAIVSGNQNLRGYTSGSHRGDQLLTAEAEYRWTFQGRWGLAAFAGFGFVGPDWSVFSTADILPAAGLGLRYRLIETYKINARVDYGWGQDDQALFISIGEAY